jgi:hypothetical protein
MAAQYGPHRWSAGYHDDGHNDAHRGARFTVADLTGARFVDCDLSQVKIVDSWLVDVNLSGYLSNFVVNGVASAFVAAEWRATPERGFCASCRRPTTSALVGHDQWRSGRTPSPAPNGCPNRPCNERRRGVVLRRDTAPPDLHHRLLATHFLDEPMPITDSAPRLPTRRRAALGMDLDARPSFAEVMIARTSRMALVRGLVDGLTDAEPAGERLRPAIPRNRAQSANASAW